MPEPKYIIINGVPQKNPKYVPDWQAQGLPSVPPPPYSEDKSSQLPVVCTVEDHMAMNAVDGLANVPMSKGVQENLAYMQSPEYLRQFNVPGMQADTLMDGLGKIFARNEIPIGLMTKLSNLRGTFLHFKVDNSGSMDSSSSVKIKDACDYIKNKYHPRYSDTFLTRWEEAADRLHTLVELLAYIPTAQIKVSAFDDPRTGQQGAYFILNRSGKTPEQFIDEARRNLDNFFKIGPLLNNTPILQNLQNMLVESDRWRGGGVEKTAALYILTDGEPSQGKYEIDQIKNLLQRRANGQINPVTFLSCSNDLRDYVWMHEVEEICCSRGNAGYVGAINDYNDEAQEVAKDQGRAFPYSKGVWLLCTLAAALNPNDLDALNEPEPLTKPILDELMGRVLTEAEYRYYFDNHPHAGNNYNGVFRPDYNDFLRSANTNTIRSVQVFKSELARDLAQDMDEGDDDSEERELERARQAVRDWRKTNFSLNAGMFGQPNVRDPLVAQRAQQQTCCCVVM